MDLLSGLTGEDLGNGLCLRLLPRSGVPLVAVRLTLPRGTARAGPGKAGVADLTAQLLRRGTRRRSASQVDEALERHGIDFAAGSGDDSTVLRLSVPAALLEPALRQLFELFHRPSFPAREVMLLRRRTLAAIQADLDEADAVADRAVAREAFAPHPYAVPAEGWSRELGSLRRVDVVDFHRRSFGARGASLVLAGRLAPAAAVRLVRRIFAALDGVGPSEAPLPPVPAIAGQRVFLVDKPDATQAQIRIAGVGLRRDSPALVPCLLGNAVLGGGFSSRLVSEVRVNRGLSYGISSRLAAREAGGLFCIRSFTRVDQAGQLTQVCLDQVAKLREAGPTEEELARTRAYLRGSYQLGNETSEQLAATTAEALRYGLGEDWPRRYLELLEATPRSAVLAALRDGLLSPGRLIVAVGPARALERQLKRFGPVQVVPLRSVA
jgi:zinc protease